MKPNTYLPSSYPDSTASLFWGQIDPLFIDDTHKTENDRREPPHRFRLAGHPVGFSLLTHEDRQYNPLLQCNRNNGSWGGGAPPSENLSDPEFESATRCSHFPERMRYQYRAGWDSHNS